MAREKMSKNVSSRIGLWVGVGVALAVVTGGVVLIAKNQTDPSPAPISGDAQSILKPRPSDWVRGQIAAPITLIEYSDFQCPACAAYYPLIKKVEQAYPTQLRMIYRSWPLTQAHPHAQNAAYVAEAAGNQGKFWEMHDILFEHQQEWSKEKDITDVFKGYAKQIGLDVDQFMKDWKSDAVVARVKESSDDAGRLNLQGTPTFFLNGKQIKNPSSFDDFRYLIENAQ